MCPSLFRLTIVLFFLAFIPALSGDDAQANREVSKAVRLFRKGEFGDAADAYKAAQLYADSIVIKANALKGAARCYRKADLRYKEFECLEELLENFPAHADYDEVLDAEYAIAKAYYKGYRQPAYSWFPWIEGENRTIKIYKSALERGPFHEMAPEARLRLARLYVEDDKIEDGLNSLREVISMYPDSEECKYARYELANVLCQLAERGDGDGARGREAMAELDYVIEKYPDDPETAWARQRKEKLKGVAAERLYGLAEFYERRDNDPAAERYLESVVKDYHDTKYAYKSEKMLSDIDPGSYSAPERDNYKFKKFVKYKVRDWPTPPKKVLAVPGSGKGNWLLPVYDLDIKSAEERRAELAKAGEELDKLRRRRRQAEAERKAAERAARDKVLAEAKAEAERLAREKAEREREEAERPAREAEELSATRAEAEAPTETVAESEPATPTVEPAAAPTATAASKPPPQVPVPASSAAAGGDGVVLKDKSSSATVWAVVLAAVALALATLTIIMFVRRKKS